MESTKKTIAELEAEIKRLRALAYLDELTGLYNRHGFRIEADRFLHELNLPHERATLRQNVLIKNFAVILIDADFFKKINDVHGHAMGDAVLKLLATTILGRVRDLDIVGRWGGEEIVIGLPGASESDAAKIAEIIREKVAAEYVKKGRSKIGVTISAGVSSHAHGASLDELVHNADLALYEAKHGGRNRVVRFTELKAAK